MQELNDQQHQLFQDRYALKNENGESIERTPDEMFDRVAAAIADSEDEKNEFRKLLNDFKFVPGGRILAGAGAETEKTFYNCYVIPVETQARRENRAFGRAFPVWGAGAKHDEGSDSRRAILDTVQVMVDIMSRGGGVGINWSVLRPTGAYLTRISGTSSGPVGWMNVASAAVGEVIQGGSRRGAAMFMLDDWHPDVLNFIEAKTEKGKITNANISVAVSDQFMEAVESDKDWHFVFPDTTDPLYNKNWDGDLGAWEASGGKVKDYGQIKARAMWELLADSAWKSGEPGVVFLERYNELSTANGAEKIISVNPCGEQGLGAYSVCNLGAMNLNAYVVPAFDGDPIFNFVDFRRDVRSAIRFLDNVIDKNYYFLPETEERQKTLRRIGLGVMGLADALVRLGIRYGSDEAVSLTEKIFREMKDEAIQSSMEIATRKGPARAWRNDLWDRPYLREYKERRGLPDTGISPLRNLFLLTQAPTGTTSLLAGVNSGIEPFFALRTWREDRTGARWVIQPSLRGLGLEHFGDVDFDRVLDALALPDYVVTSSQIPVEEHIAMQAAVQKYVDSSVSKTINAPKDATLEQTREVFHLAWKHGLKGIAYYRDGSRSVQVLYHQDPNERIAVLEILVEELTAELAKANFKSKVFAQVPVVTTGTSSFKFPEGMTVMNFVGHPTNCSGSPVYEEGCQKCYTCSWTAC